MPTAKLAEKWDDTPLKLSTIIFDRQFELFKEIIQSQPGGRPFISFQEGIPYEEEGYKTALREHALKAMKSEKWRESDIGSGTILKSVIESIEISDRTCPNNLVRWENRYGHDARSHKALIDAQSSPWEVEDWFYRFFTGTMEDKDAFESYRSLAGDRYDLAAYIFFLKDWSQYMPIAPTVFEEAFQRLGIDHQMSRRCSWDNYVAYNQYLGLVQEALQDAGVSEARLIDAHSFCWMLVRLEVPSAPQTITIPAPEPVFTVNSGPTNMAMSPPDTDTAAILDDEFFLSKNLQQRRIGKLAQEIAILSEKRRLKEAGHPDPDKAVQDVSDRPALGYDIRSSEVDGTPRHIEVKAARRTGNGLSFFITQNEFYQSRHLENYHFYLVIGSSESEVSIKDYAAKLLSESNLIATMFKAVV